MKFIKILSLISFLFIVFHSNEQITSDQVGNITFSLVMPESIEGFDDNLMLKLESKIIQATSKVAIAGKGFYSDFILYPVVTFSEDNSSNFGNKKLYSKKINLDLFIKSISDGRIFSSYSQSLIGVGENENFALINSLNEFNPQSSDVERFFSSSCDKIINYFNANCDYFIGKSDALAKMGKYDEAIALLLSIPNLSAKCHTKIKDMSIEVYKQYINKECKVLLNKSYAEKSSKNYQAALVSLANIDTSANCYTDSQVMMKEIEKSLDQDEKKKWETELMKYNNLVEIEKIKINAMKEIAVAYYNSIPNTVNYYHIKN